MFLQIKTRADAVSTDPGTLHAVRDRQQQVDQRLQQLLQEHRSSEGKRLQAVRRRQRLLQKAVGFFLGWGISGTPLWLKGELQDCLHRAKLVCLPRRRCCMAT